ITYMVFNITLAIYPSHTPLYHANQPFGKLRHRGRGEFPPRERKSISAFQSLIKGAMIPVSYCTDHRHECRVKRPQDH
uniref:Uncharacterized protein n=1 Tax=Oryctolagus cuniculus TaxID=9986 RepID=A0A5F9D5M2_RABIT